MSSSDLADSARQVSEHAYTLWTEAAMLASLIRESPHVGLHPVVLLTNKSAELCQLAQMIHEMIRDQRGAEAAQAGGGTVQASRRPCVREPEIGTEELPTALP